MKAKSTRFRSGERHHGRTMRDTCLSRDEVRALSRDACGAAPVAGTGLGNVRRHRKSVTNP
jgi:hypothetical protein